MHSCFHFILRGIALPWLFFVSSSLTAAEPSVPFCAPKVASFAPALVIAPTVIEDAEFNVAREPEIPFFSPDGNYWFVAAGEDVQVWSSAELKVVGRIQRGTSYFVEYAYDHRSKTLRTIDMEGQVRSWSLTGELRSKFSLEKYCVGHLSPDAKYVLQVCKQGEDDVPNTLIVRNAVTGDVVAKLLSRMGDIRNVEFSPDGSKVATATRKGAVRVDRISDAAPLLQADAKEKIEIGFSPDSDLLLVSGASKTRVIRIADGEVIFRNNLELHAMFQRMSNLELLLASPDHVFQIRLGGEPAPLPPMKPNDELLSIVSYHEHNVEAWALSSDGNELVVIYDDARAFVFNTKDKTVFGELTGINFTPHTVSFTNHDLGVVLSTVEGKVLYWDLKNLRWDVPGRQTSSDGELLIENAPAPVGNHFITTIRPVR